MDVEFFLVGVALILVSAALFVWRSLPPWILAVAAHGADQVADCVLVQHRIEPPHGLGRHVDAVGTEHQVLAAPAGIRDQRMRPEFAHERLGLELLRGCHRELRCGLDRAIVQSSFSSRLDILVAQATSASQSHPGCEIRPMNYVDVDVARSLPGVRLVLTAGFPGPWGQAVKKMFELKSIAYVAVAQYAGQDNAALREWVGIRNAPVIVTDDQPPLSTSFEAIMFAERCYGSYEQVRTDR